MAAPKTVPDQLVGAAPGSVQIGGWLGERMDLCLRNRVLAQDIAPIVRPFETRTEQNSGDWRCEYWGKWFTSLALGTAYTGSAEARAKLDDAVARLLRTQTPDGYIGTYKDSAHLGIWDVWGRKYTLLGLLADYDLTGNQTALEAARKVADHLLKEAPPGKVNLTATGIDVLKGLASSSILEPMVLLYTRTGDRRYLQFAEQIVADWSKPNEFTPRGLRLLEDSEAGVLPLKIGSPKAYEMMSCFEGVCELYRVTGDKRLLNSAVKFAESIRRSERMVFGSGSNQELWADGVRVQTEVLEQPAETCVTITWMKLCYQMLRLTGNPVWADEMELSLYNALAGAMTPQGEWWAYFSPLEGRRLASQVQHADVGLSCCVANGPRGLLLTPSWAVMGRTDGVTVNLYAPGSSKTRVDGSDVLLEQQTEYPVGDSIQLTVTPGRPQQKFTLYLRIPEWSEQTALTVNGQPIPCSRGTYAQINRRWSQGDKVELRLDLRGRALRAPSGAPEFAVMRGPVLLALDSRLTPAQDLDVRLVTDASGRVDLKPAASNPAGVWMAFDVPFEVRPSHFFRHHQVMLGMCDYASAGNQWSEENLFRVWLPQPLFLREMYPHNTWKLTYPDLSEPPAIPTAIGLKSAMVTGGFGSR